MARTIRDTALETRTARSRLRARGKPYYRALEAALHLGYRKPLSGPGKWIARHYIGDQRYVLETIGGADDFSDADGVAVLSYRQAQALARERMVARAHQAAGKHGPLTVADAMADYVAYLEDMRRSPDSVQKLRYTINAHILPALGDVEIVKLTTDQLRRWCADLAKRPARLRTRIGEPQAYRDGRRSPAAARRIWISLRAALQRAFDNDKVPSDAAWRKLRNPFPDADVPRERYLSLAECKRLINAASPEFRPLLQGALLTGARYGQLTTLVVSDFNRDANTLRLRSRKGRGKEKIHYAHLSDEGRALFASICAGRKPSALIFTHADGRPWGRAHQLLPLQAASKRAGIHPAANFHMTRHSFASHAVMNGAPLLVVAKTLGHSDTRLVEKVYGHLAPSYVADEIRKRAPRFGIKPSKIVSIT